MNVGSNQVQQFRHSLLKKQGELVIGKNVSLSLNPYLTFSHPFLDRH